MNYKFIITGGGTSGHINPAISIADAITKRCKQQGDNCDIIFTGREKGLENELVSKAGYEMKYIEARPFPMRPTPKLFAAIKALYVGRKQCAKIISDFAPDAVIGTGGYVCAPLLLEASKKKIPVFLHESNAFPGRANKLLARKATVVMTGFSNHSSTFKNARKAIFTGNPIRTALISSCNEVDVKSSLGIDKSMKIVFIMGGSLGAKTLNEFALEASRSDVFSDTHFVLSAGKQQQQAFMDSVVDKPNNLTIMEYIDNPYQLLSQADVSITRSGAVTCAEVAAVGACSILVPYPHAAHDHQTFNATMLSDPGAAIQISDSDVAQGKLDSILRDLLDDNKKQETMRSNAKKLAVMDSDKRIADAIFGQIKVKQNG